jgi:hypothetical protein
MFTVAFVVSGESLQRQPETQTAISRKGAKERQARKEKAFCCSLRTLRSFA